MKRSKRFALLFVAVNLVPAMAFGDEAAVAHDLSLSEVKSTFINFSADIVGNEEGKSAKLFGMIYEKCRDQFDFSSRETSKGIAFQIHDKGAGTQCMTDLRALRKDSCQIEKCVRLSEIVAIDLKGKRDGPIGIVRLVENDDRNPEQFDRIDSLEWISPETIAKNEVLREERARKDQINLARSQINGCTRTTGELDVARGALSDLLGLGELQEGELEKISGKLDLAELEALYREADTTPIEELWLTRERLLSLSAEKPKLHEKIATVLYKITQRYWTNAEEHLESFTLAKETLAEALGLSGLKAASKERFKIYQGEIAFGETSALAENGNSPEFRSSYRDMVKSLNKSYNKDCGGRRSSMEACMNTVNMIQRTQQLPYKAAQVDQQKWQNEARMQQQLQLALNPAVNTAGQQLQQPQQLNNGLQSPWGSSSGFNGGFTPTVNTPSGNFWAGSNIGG